MFNTALKKVKGSLFISLKSRNFARLFKQTKRYEQYCDFQQETSLSGTPRHRHPRHHRTAWHHRIGICRHPHDRTP